MIMPKFIQMKPKQMKGKVLRQKNTDKNALKALVKNQSKKRKMVNEISDTTKETKHTTIDNETDDYIKQQLKRLKLASNQEKNNENEKLKKSENVNKNSKEDLVPNHKKKKKKQKSEVQESDNSPMITENETEVINETEKLSATEGLAENESKVTKKTVKFTKLTEKLKNEKQGKVSRVLPYWLSHPTVVSQDLSAEQKPVEEMKELSQELKTLLQNNNINTLFPGEMGNNNISAGSSNSSYAKNWK